jgi:transcription antitermination factor NusG
MAMHWYVVHAYSGYEKRVMQALKERIARSGMEDLFGEVLVPTEEVLEMRAGQKRKSERKFFPGYVLVEMELKSLVLSVARQTSLRRSRRAKPTVFCSALKRVRTSPGTKLFMSQVKWFGSLTVHSTILPVPLKK